MLCTMRVPNSRKIAKTTHRKVSMESSLMPSVPSGRTERDAWTLLPGEHYHRLSSCEVPIVPENSRPGTCSASQHAEGAAHCRRVCRCRNREGGGRIRTMERIMTNLN